MRKTCERRALRDNSLAYIFRGSEYGMCAHRHIASLRGMVEGSVDAKTRRMFDAGNRGEVLAKRMLNELALKDPRFRVVEDASGYQSQDSVSVIERRTGFPDDVDREVRLICSPDGRLSGDVVSVFRDAGWLQGLAETSLFGMNDWALEVKCYGKSSIAKMKSKGVKSSASLDYQTSGVAAGFEAREGRPHGVVVLVLERTELKDDDGNFVDYDVPEDQTPMIWVYERPSLTAAECLQRCWDIVNAYEMGQWVKCDAPYFCRFPHRIAPIIDAVAEEMLANLETSWSQYQSLLRDVEGLLIGASNGDVVHGFQVARQLMSVPVVRRL